MLFIKGIVINVPVPLLLNLPTDGFNMNMPADGLADVAHVWETSCDIIAVSLGFIFCSHCTWVPSAGENNIQRRSLFAIAVFVFDNKSYLDILLSLIIIL